MEKKPAKKKVAKKKVAKKVTKKKVAKKVTKKKVAGKKTSKIRSLGSVGGKELKMIEADNLPDALKAIAKDLNMNGIDAESLMEMLGGGKVRTKLKIGSAEAEKLNAEWDEYESSVRADLNGELEGQTPIKLAMLGAQLDHQWQGARTPHIKKSMLKLGIDVVTKLNDMPTPEGLPKELVEMKRKSAESVVTEYKRQLELLEAPEREKEEKAEREFVSAPAGGVFANVSIGDILNAPKADDLPDH